MTLLLWLGLAVVGASASAGFLARLQFRLRHRSTHRQEGDGWQRGRRALLGLIVSLLATGAGLGGALSTVLQPQVPVERGPLEMRGWSNPDSALERTRGIQSDPAGPLFPDTGSAETAVVPASVPSEPSQPPGAESPAPDTPVPGPPGAGSWAVRVGVFGVEANARTLVEQLEAAGLPGFVVSRTDDGDRTLRYVYAGRYATRDSAEASADRVRAAGMDAMVVEFTPPSP